MLTHVQGYKIYAYLPMYTYTYMHVGIEMCMYSHTLLHVQTCKQLHVFEIWCEELYLNRKYFCVFYCLVSVLQHIDFETKQ